MTTLFRDKRKTPVQVAELGTTQSVAYTAASASSTIIAKGVVRLVASTACHVKFGVGSATATTNDPLMSAGIPEYFEININDTIAVIRLTDDGTLFITEML